MLAQVFHDAGINDLLIVRCCRVILVELPPGVANVVFGVGPRVGQALITNPDVNVISFTGSTVVGYHIKKATVDLPVKLSLEVGEFF
jgi:acyl-CoA reductase-like NAD-dependent aldehyde dehydrogenase